jgi:hypothetical protein
MFYSGSISPQRSPALNKPKKEMGDDPSSVPSGVKESSLMWPMLSRSNYSEWAMLMQCNSEAMEIWETIEPGGAGVKRAQGRQTMSALLHFVPKEMLQTLGGKKTVKEAWEAVKTMRLSADHVKDVNAQKLLKVFENLQFKEGETIDHFFMHITNLVANLKTLGETLDDVRVVKKFLRVVHPRFTSVVVSIEMFCDLKKLTVEELIERLRAAEERFDEKMEEVTDKAERLLMAEEEWLEKHKHRFQAGPKESCGSSSGSSLVKNKAARSDGGSSGPVKLTSEGMPRWKGRYCNCGVYDHWAQDCKRPKKEKKEARQLETNVAMGGAEQPALMLAICDVDIVYRPTQIVHLTESVIPKNVPDGVWLLDTGASNHMTGMRSALTLFDEGVHDTVRFGDGCRVEMQGIGSVVMQGRQGQHKVLTNVYFIPKLQSNIVSLGQLEEKGLRSL